MAVGTTVTNASSGATKTVSGYLGALRASVLHLGIESVPLRIDYSMNIWGNDGRISIKLNLTDIGFRNGKDSNEPLGSYVMEIEKIDGFLSSNDIRKRIKFYKEGKESMLAGANPALSRINTSNPKKLIERCAVELLVATAEESDTVIVGYMLSPKERRKTEQVLAVIRQAAVDSQGASANWGKQPHGIHKRG